MTSSEVIGKYGQYLTRYERGEILEYPAIYYFGQNAKKPNHSDNSAGNMHNHGFDDKEGDYLITMRDHLHYRYEMIESLGKGSFGQVMRAIDHASGKHVAIKVIKNRTRFHEQALVEVKLLECVTRWDRDGSHSLVQMYDHFYFRRHLCIVFELLSLNLYEYLKANNFVGCTESHLREFGRQMLRALCLLKHHRVIHCDLKPENILLKDGSGRSTDIKVIDFGSSCFENERVYTYIQSRFYRSPEVILGGKYGTPIDMWSFGCILAELLVGYPLFPGENEQEQLWCILEIKGVPPESMLKDCSRRSEFFDSQGNPRPYTSKKGKRRKLATKALSQMVKTRDDRLLNFLARCLEWEPEKRMTPVEAANHPWITDSGKYPPAESPIHSLSSTGTSNTPVSTSRPSQHHQQQQQLHHQQQQYQRSAGQTMSTSSVPRSIAAVASS
ncbi:kinase-like protein [Ramicandelaber brevisporus]|nr:kinase-like protein [Ramicandelaber brevisporus]